MNLVFVKLATKTNKSHSSYFKLFLAEAKTTGLAIGLGFLLMANTTNVMAQTPNAGVLQQNIERERQNKLPTKEPQPVLPAPVVNNTVKDTATVSVQQFQFSGNTLISDVELTALLQQYRQKPLTINDLNMAAANVAQHYRQQGWLVRTGFPEQDITDGIVIIGVIEAQFGGISYHTSEGVGAGDEKLTAQQTAQVTNIFEHQLANGEKLDLGALDRGLLISNDLPGVVVSGSLVEGVAQNQTQLKLNLSKDRLFSGRIQLDNHGSRSTGPERILGLFSLNNPTNRGDQLSATLMHTQGSDYLWLEYSMPVGSNGWRIAASASKLNYEMIASEFSGLDIEGSSSSMGVEATYPLIRSRNKNVFLAIGYRQEDFDNDILSSDFSNYDIRRITAELSGNRFDDYYGGGVTSATAQWVMGDLDLSKTDIGENPDLDNQYYKLRVSVSRQQMLTDDITLMARISGQIADSPLDSYEKFYLGGPSGVRAYPVSEAGGTEGWAATVEVSKQLKNNLLLSTFVDAGHVYEKGSGPDYDLYGGGLRLNWAVNQAINVDAIWSHRIGNNPNKTATGKDQDGSLKTNRFWLSASWNF